MPAVVVVDYADLCSHSSNLDAAIQAAYGADGLGVLAIRGIPGFLPAKNATLHLAHGLSHLPKDQLAELEDEKSLYNAGWSHGKEKLGDKPDLAKGSFYFNPLIDVPGTPKEREQYPSVYPVNVWPTRSLPQLEPAAKRLGRMMHDTVVKLAFHIDRFAMSTVPGYEERTLHTAMSQTVKAKGRLLYYFPLTGDAVAKPAEDSWIGWHNDSGFLTALAGDMYVMGDTGERIACPDPEAGLYVVNRAGESVRVDIPEDCMAVQLGECTQIVTGGALVATPHCVRGANVPGVARISHPCFIDVAIDFPLKMPGGCTRKAVLCSSTSDKVPPLGHRWTSDGQKFGDFLTATFARYYDWTTPAAKAKAKANL